MWCERQLDDALATLVGYTAFLVASFRRLALLDVHHGISWGVTRRQSIWLATDVYNQRMHDERRMVRPAVWLIWFPPSRDPYRYKEKRFTFSFISTNPGVTETSADAIVLPMAFDGCQLTCHVPRQFE